MNSNFGLDICLRIEKNFMKHFDILVSCKSISFERVLSITSKSIWSNTLKYKLEILFYLVSLSLDKIAGTRSVFGMLCNVFFASWILIISINSFFIHQNLFQTFSTIFSLSVMIEWSATPAKSFEVLLQSQFPDFTPAPTRISNYSNLFFFISRRVRYFSSTTLFAFVILRISDVLTWFIK